MMRNPEHGWCLIELAGYRISGSYLEDYPYTIPEALITAIEKTTAGDVSDTEPLSSFSVEQEPGITTFTFHRNHTSVESDAAVFFRNENVETNNDGYLFALADELCQDLNDYYDGWVYWMDHPDDGFHDQDHFDQRRKDIAGFMTKLYELSVTRPDGK